MAAGVQCSSNNAVGPSNSAVPPPSPTIALSSTSVNFTATAGGTSPAAQNVAITNGGDGTLSGLTIGSITYGSGASGWLTANVSPTTAPASVSLTPTLGTLAAGNYTATVFVTSSATDVTNSPQTISVTFAVSGASAPTIVLSTPNVTLTATVGGTSPPAQTVAVTNGGSGALSGLAIGAITYGVSASARIGSARSLAAMTSFTVSPPAWLQATLSATSAPATVTLTATLGTLAPGSYTATVPVTSSASGVTNSPQNISVTFTVNAQPAPVIALSSTSLTFAATAGGSSPAAQTVSVTNGGSGTLSGLAIGTITYGAGASGWLAASLSATSAPATVTLTATLGILAPGSYTAIVPVASSASGVTNSPQNIGVAFTVSGVAPATPTGLTVTATTTSSVSLSWGASSGATSYQLYRNGTEVYSNSLTSYTDLGLASGTTYQYAVRATNAYGSSAQSNPVSGTTVATAQVDFWSNDATDGSINAYVDGTLVGTLTQHFLYPSKPTWGATGTLLATVQPGSHTLSALSTTGVTWNQTVTVTPGEQLLYQFVVSQWCFWTDRSNVGSYIDVYINGSLVAILTQYFTAQPSWGQAGTAVVTEPPGTYSLTAVSQSGVTWSGTVTLTAGQQQLYELY
jgi:hypothetical protein